MKRLFLAIFFLIITTSIFGQYTYYSVVSADDSVGTTIKLNKGEIPAGIFTNDTLYTYDGGNDTTKLVQFYIWFGDTTGWYNLDKWLVLTVTDNADSNYTTSFKRGKTTPFNPLVFYDLIANPNMPQGAHLGDVYLKPKILYGVSKTDTVGIKTRNY
jgi:hypothetical protein